MLATGVGREVNANVVSFRLEGGPSLISVVQPQACVF